MYSKYIRHPFPDESPLDPKHILYAVQLSDCYLKSESSLSVKSSTVSS